MPAYVQNDALKFQELSALFDKGNNNIDLMCNLFKNGNREGGKQWCWNAWEVGRGGFWKINLGFIYLYTKKMSGLL